MKKIEQLRLEDLAKLAKAKSDANAIIYLVTKFRRSYGNDYKYMTQIQERAKNIVREIDSTS